MMIIIIIIITFPPLLRLCGNGRLSESIRCSITMIDRVYMISLAGFGRAARAGSRADQASPSIKSNIAALFWSVTAWKSIEIGVIKYSSNTGETGETGI